MAGLLEWLGAAGHEGYQAAALDLARLRTESGIAFASRPAEAGGAGGAGGIGDALPVVLAAADWAVPRLDRVRPDD